MHGLVGDARLVERFTLRLEAGLAVKLGGVSLGMEVNSIKPCLPRQFNQLLQHHATEAPAAELGCHCQPADLAFGQQPPIGNGLAVMLDHHVP